MAEDTGGLPDHASAPRTDRLLLTSVVLVVLSMSVAFAYSRWGMSGLVRGGSPFDVADGVASTPFQYRLLFPSILGWLGLADPPSERAMPTAFAIVEAASFFGFFACVERIGACLGMDARPRALLVLGLLGVPFLYLVVPPFRPFYNLSDAPATFVLAACAWALIERRYVVFTGLFLVGTLNRETTLLVLAAWALTAVRAKHREVRVWVLACLLGWLAIKAALFFRYQDNPGAGLFEVQHRGGAGVLHLTTNLTMLGSWPRVAWIVGLVLAPLGVAVGARSSAHPLMQSMIDVVGAYVLVAFVIGNFDELRMFGDAFAILAIATATALASRDAGPRADQTETR